MENTIKKKKRFKKWNLNDYELLIMAFTGLAFLIVFAYFPMYGIILAFKQGDGVLNIAQAIFGSPWAEHNGFGNFIELFNDTKFWAVFRNTVTLNVITIVISFPAPIIFALLVNEIRNRRFKKFVQTFSIVPHFISWTVFGGIILNIIDPSSGIINTTLEFFGFNGRLNLVAEENIWGVIIVSELIKSVGWGSIVYVAAIAGINPEIYEAATVDGANRFQKMIYVTIPGISATIITFLILRISRLLGNSFEEFYVFQKQININRTQVLSTYIYSEGIGSTTSRRYSYTAAMGLVNSVIGMILLLTSNFISKKLTDKGLF